MATASLVERVREHLTRQAAWLEDVLTELETARLDAETPDLAAAASALDRRVDERMRWESAQARLIEEWRAAAGSVSETERADVRARSEHVRELAERASEAYQRVAMQADAHKERVGEGLAQLGRGRVFLRRLYVENPDGWFMDRQA
ncbi:MAG: hypothetical protein NTU83_03440 [Candidatus Hydrogenedentes bacterium]|nr:hypothetical protein [Candidatus Hydrogenedentota bacterium]